MFVCGCMCTARLRGPYLVHFNIAAAAQLLTSRHQMIPSESEEKHPKKERERERAVGRGEMTRRNRLEGQKHGRRAKKKSKASLGNIIKMLTKSCLKSDCSLEPAD